MSTCTGPYVRVPFSHADLKPAENLVASIRGVGAPLLIREMPTGDGVADNFALHVDIEDPSIPNCIWDVRAAKFQGPKKMFGRRHVYEIAVRKRNEQNTVVWEGYRFTDKFEMLADYFCADFANLLSGVTLKTWLPATTAQEQRIQLCTGL
ncbi:hypothetical protein [Magnetovibrio blakemorei]|uniref:Uncharacterized protein n=1 Tax=Magnetovibrio blakemorei TaxID=28181 RepID=A0A1E5Q948_9PROT|nr:hypothetical protein [Magnetovibrio blakemorei]OEJ67578.1 hypothetical protein BEN30_09120 [Magnetovibrio blakemorei]